MTGGVPVPATCASGSCGSCATSALELRVHVANRTQVGRAWTRVQLAEQRVVPRLGLQPGDAARRIVQIAEDDRVGGTDLLTRRLDLAVADRTIFFFGVDLRLVDALHAVGALLHHA